MTFVVEIDGLYPDVESLVDVIEVGMEARGFGLPDYGYRLRVRTMDDHMEDI